MTLEALESYRAYSYARRNRMPRPSVGRYSPLLRYRENPARHLQVQLPKPVLVEATEQRRQANPRLYGSRTVSPQARIRESRANASTMQFAAAMMVLPLAAILIATRPVDQPSYGRSGEDLRRKQYIPG